MEKFTVKELTSVEPGSLKFEVIAILGSDPLKKSLVEAGVLGKIDDLEFFIMDEQIAVRFRTSGNSNLHIIPRIQEAQNLVIRAVNEVRRVKKIIRAIELTDRK